VFVALCRLIINFGSVEKMLAFPLFDNDFYVECCEKSDHFTPETATSKYWSYTGCFEEYETTDDVYMMFNKKRTVEDKFLYVHGLLKKYHKLPLALTNVSFKKNNEVALNMRNMGNKRFKKKFYENAFYNYNSSIMMAEIGSPEYAFAVANRSVALFYMKEYDACIRDIHYAILNGYPSQLAYKLYQRELRCLAKMGKISEARSKLEVRIIMCLLQNPIYTIRVDFDYLNLFKTFFFSEIFVLHFTIVFG